MPPIVPRLVQAAAMLPRPVWGIPFLGLMLSIGVLPVLAPKLWHRRMEWITALWCLVLVAPMAVAFGPLAALASVGRAVQSEYLPLMGLLLALYVAGGGILIEGGRLGTPAGNTGLLAIGALLAGVLGTTGAAIVLIRPLLRGNAHRRRRVHLVVFFIVLVANAGGGTTPLGDPPLYVGFLRGVPFFWPMRHLAAPLLLVIAPMLLGFFLLDLHLSRTEPPPPHPRRVRIDGGYNIVLVGLVALLVIGEGLVRGGSAVVLGQPIAIPRLVALAGCLAIALLSLAITPRRIREANFFRWEPLHEVAVLFAGLFITVAPVLAMLAQGAHGPLGPLLGITHNAAGAPRPSAYFWLTGLLSGFLDSAPSYLVFFEQAGGDPAALTGPYASTLVAISAGSVLFGAISYIGNAPNMMVRAIAEHQDVPMPSFFAYVAIASVLLVPWFVVLNLLFL